MFKVFLPDTDKYHYIIKVDQADLPAESGEHKFHQPLKSVWRIANPLLWIVTEVENAVFLIPGVYFNLPVPD